MSTKKLFDTLSLEFSKRTTEAYSTSFTLGIKSLNAKHRMPVYAVYGFVRFADEIVDTFHEFDKVSLFADFRAQTHRAITDRISLNPILNSFQWVYHTYGFTPELVETFLKSMETDLCQKDYDRQGYEEYILGSAEVVGLMCLKIFTSGNAAEYDRLKPYAMKLGSAFQKINFLRDLQADHQELGRRYFPELQNNFELTPELKTEIEIDIEADFEEGLKGIRMLPKDARRGVHLAYSYYRNLFHKIRSTPPERMLHERVRVSDSRKFAILVTTFLKHRINSL